MKKIAIIGFGSIGKRHYKNFKSLGIEVAVVTKQNLDQESVFTDIVTCVKDYLPEAVFICNETFLHLSTILLLKKNNYQGLIITEKPLSHNLDGMNLQDEYLNNIKISYNFRFNPMLLRLKNDLVGEEVTSAICYVGQYLPSWRPHADYKLSYSAHQNQGGGVVLDLSHELDYCSWLFGPVKTVYASGGKLSNLEITSEDTVAITAKHELSKLVSTHLNYTDRITNRFLIVNTNNKTIKIDFINKTYESNFEKVKYDFDSNDPYVAMAKDIVLNQGENMTSFTDAFRTAQLIEKIYQSMKENVCLKI